MKPQFGPITFCAKKRCCPEVYPQEDGRVIIGGQEEGFTTFSKQNFQDFVKAAKSGKFDGLC